MKAVDHEVSIAITPITDKTFKLTCDSCTWMETAASSSAAGRKRNLHLAEHRKATEGADGIPTIYDAIADKPVDLGEPLPHVEPVEFTPGQGATITHASVGEEVLELPEVGDDLIAAGPAVRALLEHHGVEVPAEAEVEEGYLPPDAPRTWVCDGCMSTVRRADIADMVDGEHVLCWDCRYESSEQRPLEPPEKDEWIGNPPVGRVEAAEAALDEAWPPEEHTRTQTDAGPDYCAECSAAAHEWVKWGECPGSTPEEVIDVPMSDVPEPILTPVDLTRERLAAQQGSSDRDREEWLAERSHSVSATLVAKLGLASEPNLDFVIHQQVQEKIHGSTFAGNAYTAWGKEREPHLEAVGKARHGIEPESHLFFSRANPRHSASPDGIAIHPWHGGVCLGEYKTSGKELHWDKVVSNGYYDQVQWQLYVLEASHCWLIWEWRRTDEYGEGFRAEVGGEHLIMRDEARIAELVRRADLFLAALDAERARLEAEGAAPIDPHLRWLVSTHLEAKAAARDAEENLRAYCEANDVKSLEIEGLARVSYSFGSPRSTFDKDRFEQDYPGIYDQYKTEGKAPERATLRVTAKGGEEE